MRIISLLALCLLSCLPCSFAIEEIQKIMHNNTLRLIRLNDLNTQLDSLISNVENLHSSSNFDKNQKKIYKYIPSFIKEHNDLKKFIQNIKIHQSIPPKKKEEILDKVVKDLKERITKRKNIKKDYFLNTSKDIIQAYKIQAYKINLCEKSPSIITYAKSKTINETCLSLFVWAWCNIEPNVIEPLLPLFILERNLLWLGSPIIYLYGLERECTNEKHNLKSDFSKMIGLFVAHQANSDEEVQDKNQSSLLTLLASSPLSMGINICGYNLKKLSIQKNILKKNYQIAMELLGSYLEQLLMSKKAAQSKKKYQDIIYNTIFLQYTLNMPELVTKTITDYLIMPIDGLNLNLSTKTKPTCLDYINRANPNYEILKDLGAKHSKAFSKAKKSVEHNKKPTTLKMSPLLACLLLYKSFLHTSHSKAKNKC